MALNIKAEETDALARELAAATGETITEAVTEAVRERLGRVRAGSRVGLADQLDEIAVRAAALPVLDVRSAEEIVDYDDDGIPR